MIQEQYVSFETAKLLKEKGFDICCQMLYLDNEHPFLTDRMDDCRNYYKNSELASDEYSAPTQALAMRWLREKFNYVINIDLDSYVEGCDPMGYYIVINQYGAPYREVSPTFIDRPNVIFFKTYEEAAEEAIKYVLQVLI